MLFFVMYSLRSEKDVTKMNYFDIETLEMERLWCCDTNEPRQLGGLSEVYPYEMVAWPPVLKDFVH